MRRVHKQIHVDSKAKRYAFHLCRFVLFLLVCVLFNKSFIVFPAVVFLSLNSWYMYLLLRGRGFKRKIVVLLNLLTSVLLCGRAMTDHMVNLPRFVERSHREWFGMDDTIVLWFLFWASFVVLARVALSKRKARGANENTP